MRISPMQSENGSKPSTTLLPFSTAALLAAALLATAGAARADEGMWLLNKLPRERLKTTYDFEPTDAWATHVQRSCIRVGTGGSASFVSPNGLLMTNHHVASELIADLSDAEHDYMRDGFYAPTRDAELRCPDTELDVLMEIRDVTNRVNAGVRPDMRPAEAREIRQQAMAEIEAEAKNETGLIPEIVTLYQGAQYHLYLYKRYTDVRLVFAPEQGIAFFGGDLDNFEYPRYNLDISFLRAYEDGKPARTEPYLKWSRSGAAEGDLVFIAGHPGRTQRLYTVEHLAFLRDVYVPLILNGYNQREVALLQFAAQGREPERIARDDLLGIQNGRKAYNGILAGLLNDALFQKKVAAQKRLLEFIESDEARRRKYGGAHEDLAEALGRIRPEFPAYFLMENRRMKLCRLFDIAKKLVRAAAERPKADGQRYEEYRDAALPSLELDLFSTSPIYPELDRLRLEDGLLRLGRVLGGGHPIVQAALHGGSAEDRAASLIAGTRLADIAYRRELYEGGSAAIAECDDPMILLARALEPASRKLRDHYEREFEAVERASYAKIARALFERDGDTVYPDATFTLRVAIGTVKGYEEPGRTVPAMTTFRGLYKRAAQKEYREPFNLPDRWRKAEGRLDLGTPFNFVCTNDIIGGNSGSPIFDRKGEIVGIVFDGNIHGLIWDFQFDQQRARAVGVDGRAIIEALRTVYGTTALVDEILGK